MEEREVKLSQDHLQRQAKCSAERAIEELIWNALDAGGLAVDVRFDVNELGVVTALEVADYGCGIPFEALDRAFGTIGMSLKVEQRITSEGRVLHGSEGRGRFRALVLGARATWRTTYMQDGAVRCYEIAISRVKQEKFLASEPKMTDGTSGTVVRVDGVDKGEKTLLTEGTRGYLSEHLAVYLKNYPDVVVTYDGSRIDAKQLTRSVATYELGPAREGGEVAWLDVIEWTFEVQVKKLLICDMQGFARHEVPLGVHARGISLSAYLRCAEAKEWFETEEFGLSEFDREITGLIESAKTKLREYVRERHSEEAKEVVQQWKEEKIYPYSEDEPDTPIHRAERQVFDIVASRVHLYHEPFRAGETRSRQLTLQLMRQAVETSPTSLKRILETVLRLPPDQRDELADLFERIGVEKIMAAAKEVERRLQAIKGLETILFDDDWKKRLLERTQLHRLLVHQLWIFGDEYTLDADDESLRVVLKKHLAHLGRDELAPEVNVKLIDGKEGIVDLMISRRFARDKQQIEHLVIELKRPSRPLGDKELSQIKNYAYAVARDERFSKEHTRWTFVLIGNDWDEFAEMEAQPKGNLPYGCLQQAGQLTIWIKRWSELLHEASSRYDFFRERLEIEASSAEGLAYLQEHYTTIMSGKGVSKKKDKELEVGVASATPTLVTH